MIQINLLPVKEEKRRKQMFIVFYAAVSGVLFLAILGWFWWSQYQKVDDLKEQIKTVEEESKGYEDKIKEVKDLQAKESALEGYRAAISAIYDDQKKVLSALDEIGTDAPNDILLDSIEQGRDKDEWVFTIKGLSMTRGSVQDYVNRLRRPGGPLKNTSVENIAFKTDKGTSASYAFTLKVEIGGAQ
jgi:Tfp pilus assembly protein PilN